MFSLLPSVSSVPSATLKRSSVVIACLAGAVLLLGLAGCGGSAPVTAHNPSPVKPSAPFVRIETLQIGGVTKTILATAPGLTLYYYALDTATTVACQEACTTEWRPFIFAGSGPPIAPPSLSGALSVIATAHGNQVEYNGHPLYTYSKDVAPGQANGQGISGKWFVATTNLTEDS
jgi:predicted lipoprotein with Yx(FWY)xxD motif